MPPVILHKQKKITDVIEWYLKIDTLEKVESTPLLLRLRNVLISSTGESLAAASCC